MTTVPTSTVTAAPLATACAQRLLRYWREKGGGGTPARREIDPIDLRDVLPYTFMMDVTGMMDATDGADGAAGGPGFVFRLVGTEVVDLFGRNLTGTRVDAHHSAELAFWKYVLMRKVVVDRAPLAVQARAVWPGDSWTGVELLYLPFDAGGTVGLVLGSACRHGAISLRFEPRGDPWLAEVVLIDDPQA